MMSEMLVSFKNPEEILNFVNTVAKYPYDMDMKRGRFVVDAKSILGIMNLGLNNVISLQVYGDHCGTSATLSDGCGRPHHLS